MLHKSTRLFAQPEQTNPLTKQTQGCLTMRKLFLMAAVTGLSLQAGSVKAASVEFGQMATQVDLAMALAIPAVFLIGFGIMLHAASQRF
jgi:hypothetical protein